MMFSRAAPVVLFTAFCLSATGAYIGGGFEVFSTARAVREMQINVLDRSFTEMKLALQVGDTVRFEELISARMKMMQTGRPDKIKMDELPAPYGVLRTELMAGDVAQVRALLKAHPKLDLNRAQGRYGAVPLIWATGNESQMPEMIAVLLKAGARPNFASARGYTVLHAMASPFNSYVGAGDVADAVALLPDELIRQTTGAGLSALHLALVGNKTEQVIALLERGADANTPPPLALGEDFAAGQPPLMIAGGNLRMVAALLKAGADPVREDSHGRSILGAVTQGALAAEQALLDRLSASEAEEHDRQNAADYARARGMIQTAIEARLARGQ